MKVLKSLLVAVGVFVAVQVIAVVVGMVVVMQRQTLDPNGITSTPAPGTDEVIGTIVVIAFLVGLVLAAVAGIVYGVNPSNPRVAFPPETSVEFRKRSGLDE